MKLLPILLLVLIGCATDKPKKPTKKFKSRIDRRTECVLKFISKDVLPLEASQICETIYKR